MKLPLTPLLLALALTSSVTRAEESPGTSATIPYEELKTLLEAARPKKKPEPPAPPVDAVLTAADYRFVPTAITTRIQATYRLSVLAKGWQLIPLVGGEPRLESSTVSPSEDVRIVTRGGTYHALARTTGTFEITLNLSAPSPASDAWPRGSGLVLAPATSTVNRLVVEHPGDLPRLKPRLATPSSTTGDATTYHLPAQGEVITIDVEEAERVDHGTPAEPSVWDLDTQTLVNVAPARLDYRVRIFASTTAGDATAATLTLPPNAAGISVEDAPGLRWHTDRSDPAARAVHLSWVDRGPLDREIALTYHIPQSPLATDWTLHAPATAGDGSARHLFVIAKADGLELAHPDLQTTTGSVRLPDWMHTAIAGRDFLTLESGTPPTLTASWLPRVQPAEATATDAAFTTQVAADGTLLTTATYTVKHAAPFAWSVSLPAQHQLLACTAGDKPLAPIARPDTPGLLELPLPANDDPTTVTLTYTEKLDPLDALSGRAAIAAPQTDTFIHTIKWGVTLPDGYTFAGVEGNLRTTGSETVGTVQLTRQLCRADRPAIELHYTTQP